MKRCLLVIILILTSCLCVSCGKTPTISYAKKEIQINFDEIYTIEEEDISIKNSKNNYKISILNTEIAELNKLTIIPKNKGKTYIRFELENEDVYIDIPLTVTHIIYATSAEIQNQNVVLNINLQQETYNKIILNSNCNEQPQVSYDRNVISYDYITGKIVPVKVGTTNVVVLYNACNVSFTVTVIDIVYTSAIDVKEHLLYLGSEGVFEYSVYPAFANTFCFYSFSDKLTVAENGEYIANDVGEYDVYVEYFTNETSSVVKSFKVKVIEEIKSFSFSIVNLDESSAKYLLKEREYKIIIEDVSNILEKDIKLSDNFIVKQVSVCENYIEIIGSFSLVGQQNIKVEIICNDKLISEDMECRIYQVSDIEIVAKWSAYNQQKYIDGKYHIKLEETIDFPSYLRFNLCIDGINIAESFSIYDVTNEKLEANYMFKPTTVGEFKFEFEFLGFIVGEVLVVVE